MDKIFVIAGSKLQADQWINDKIASIISNSKNLMFLARSNFIYVDDASRLRGILNPHGFFIGTWRERADILEIVKLLLISSNLGNDALKEIYESIKPTPKGSKPFSIVKTVAGKWDTFGEMQVNAKVVLDKALQAFDSDIDWRKK